MAEIYNPVTPDIVDDTIQICQDCEDNHLEDCRKCGKAFYLNDMYRTDWYIMIPYDHDFDSGQEWHDVISTLELTFYCDICKEKLFPGMDWQGILKALKE